MCGTREDAQFGSRSARLGASLSTQDKKRYGSRPFSFAVSIRLKITALPFAPLAVLANRKFLREITKGLMLRSARLLLSSMRPTVNFTASAPSARSFSTTVTEF